MTTLLGGHPTTAGAIAAIEKHYHLNEPFLAQYFIWLKDAVRLNFGQSIASGESVSSTILQRLPVTIVLNLAGIFLATVFGITLGCAAALRRGRPTDRFVAAFSTVGIERARLRNWDHLALHIWPKTGLDADIRPRDGRFC